MGEVSGKTEDRGQRTENKISGNQGNRILGYQENGEFRICKLELRMDSVSKPALSPFGCAQGKLRRMGAE